MHHRLTSLVLGALLAGATAGAAQATGTPTFNAPYRAFSRSEIGLLLSFPNGGGTAFEGAYRFASDKFDPGFKAALFDPGSGLDTRFLLGVETREHLIAPTVD